MSTSPESKVAGTSATTARKLIDAGWFPVDDTGLWATKDITDPVTADVALRVAETLAKAQKIAAPAHPNWWTHLAGTLPGTAGMSILTAVVAAVIANPPPTAGLSPVAVEWLKWALPVIGMVLLGAQVPKSIKAAKGPPPPSKDAP